MAVADPWTGKLRDYPSDLLPKPNGGTCDQCGSACIDRCLMCGAPQCCPVCCLEDTKEQADG
jgi:hypothetical protein